MTHTKSGSRLLLITAFLFLSMPQAAKAGEGGNSQYLIGFNDFLAGVLPGAGFYFRNDSIYMNNKVGAALAEGFLETHVSVDTFANVTRLTYVTPLKILYSNWGTSLRIPLVKSKFSGEINSPIFLAEGSQNVSDLGDIVFSPLILGWHHQYFHWLVSLPTFYFPTGSYSLDNYINVGKNRYAIQADVNGTYFNTENGAELTAALGYTKSYRNYATNYQSGDEFHTDAVAAGHFSNGVSLGLAGYFLQQITGDSGAGATLGSNKGMTVGAGPAIDYSTKVKSLKINLRGKYYYNINSVNRLGGNTFWFSILLS